MIQQTSILAYTEVCKTKYALKKVNEYLKALSTFTPGASDRDVSKLLGWDPGRVSARRNEAIKDDMVMEYGRKLDNNTNKTVIVWGLKV